MTEHLVNEHHATTGRDGRHSRNGTRARTVLAEIGPVEIDVLRDRDARFTPQIVLSLTARGLTGKAVAHFEQVYGLFRNWSAGLPEQRHG